MEVTSPLMAAVTLAAVSAPVFVLGVYLSRFLAREGAGCRLLIMSSWVLILVGIVLSIALPDYARQHDREWWLRVAPVVLSALPAGMGFGGLRKDAWVALLAPTAGIVIEAVVWAYVYVAPEGRFIFR